MSSDRVERRELLKKVLYNDLAEMEEKRPQQRDRNLEMREERRRERIEAFFANNFGKVIRSRSQAISTLTWWWGLTLERAAQQTGSSRILTPASKPTTHKEEPAP